MLAALTAGVVLLAAFAVIETRSRHALMPVRLLRSRDRAGAILMMLAVGTIVSGVFFFVTLFVQELWGYSPLRTGVAFLPLPPRCWWVPPSPPSSCRGSGRARC